MIVRRINSNVATISLPDFKLPSEAELYLLQVRETKDAVINKPFKFKYKDGKNIVKVPYTKSTGFTFKCFVELKNPDKETDAVRGVLKDAGMEHISKKPNHLGRIWFIIPKYPTDSSDSGFINNIFMPF